MIRNWFETVFLVLTCSVILKDKNTPIHEELYERELFTIFFPYKKKLKCTHKKLVIFSNVGLPGIPTKTSSLTILSALSQVTSAESSFFNVTDFSGMTCYHHPFGFAGNSFIVFLYTGARCSQITRNHSWHSMRSSMSSYISRRLPTR